MTMLELFWLAVALVLFAWTPFLLAELIVRLVVRRNPFRRRKVKRMSLLCAAFHSCRRRNDETDFGRAALK